MKLLYITNAINGAAGLERVLSIKASYLAENLGYEVHIVTLNQGNINLFYDFSSKIHLYDITVTGNLFSYLKKYRSGLKNICAKINPDVISVCDDGLKAFFLPVILGNRCPIIYERHVSKIVELTDKANFFKRLFVRLKWKLMQVLGSKFDKFIVLTEENKKEWHLNNVQVIGNPLTFYPMQNATLISKKVIAVGRQSFQKGYDRLLKAWKIVNAKFPEWELTIYGKKDETLGLDTQANLLGIASSINFFGPVKDIEKQFLASSVFVFPSRFEGFGMVLIEAMACGVPCVSFDCPYGPSDIIENNVDGFLIENHNIEAFAEKIMILLEDETLRTMMGKKAKENVKRYLPETVVAEWDVLFKLLVNENSF